MIKNISISWECWSGMPGRQIASVLTNKFLTLQIRSAISVCYVLTDL